MPPLDVVRTGGRTGPLRRARAPFALCALAAVSPPSALAGGGGVQWRLSAEVPVICAILGVAAPPGDPRGLAVATSCNAERYRLVLRHGARPASLRAAHSSAGPAAISGNAVTVTSTRPGHAITTIDLAAPPGPEPLSVTLEPG